MPVTAECAHRGLGDNFLRALAMSGVGPDQRHWGIEHRPAGQSQGQGETGSSVSMTWLARHCGDHALITAATEPLDEQLRRAAAFGPDTISGSPGFLGQIARAGEPPCVRCSWCTAGRCWPTRTPTCYGRFPAARLTAFYPTTDAGALGAAAASDGVYRTFTETHLIEVLDGDGRPVAAGSRGDVVVTQFDAWAAPIIRYRVGDRATYRGWERGRLLLSDIERAAEGRDRINARPLQRSADLDASPGGQRPVGPGGPTGPRVLAGRAARAAHRAGHRPSGRRRADHRRAFSAGRLPADRWRRWRAAS